MFTLSTKGLDSLYQLLSYENFPIFGFAAQIKVHLALSVQTTPAFDIDTV